MKSRAYFSIIALTLAVLCVGVGSPKAAWASDHRPTPVAGKDTATGIEWSVGPAQVTVYLDGKKVGEAGSLKFTATTPGKHTVKLMNGKDETEMEVNVKKGQKVKFEFTFDAG